LPSWNVNDQKVPQGRLSLFSYLSAFFVVLLLIGFWKLQVMQSEHFSDLAEKNGIRAISIIAPRGVMLNGRNIANALGRRSLGSSRRCIRSLASGNAEITSA